VRHRSVVPRVSGTTARVTAASRHHDGSGDLQRRAGQRPKPQQSETAGERTQGALLPCEHGALPERPASGATEGGVPRPTGSEAVTGRSRVR
jgi:hypothetical protein